MLVLWHMAFSLTHRPDIGRALQFELALTQNELALLSQERQLTTELHEIEAQEGEEEQMLTQLWEKARVANDAGNGPLVKKYMDEFARLSIKTISDAARVIRKAQVLSEIERIKGLKLKQAAAQAAGIARIAVA